MSIQLKPSVPLVTLVKTEPPTVIKNEPPEEALEKEISPDNKDIDIVYHSLSEDLIKNESVPENILETKYLESVETRVSVKTEDTSDENVTRGTDQEVIEVQASNEHSNALSNFLKSPKKTDFVECYKTDDTTLWEKEKEKIKVIKAPMISVKAHEYTSLAKDRHVCNHCQNAYNALSSLKLHIKRMHREVTTMYQCPYCPYKAKWNLRDHITRKHKNTKDIQLLQCNLCEKKFKLKFDLTRHKMVHLREKRYHCNKCDYKTYRNITLKRHDLSHLKPEEIHYFYCYHCSYKAKQKWSLKEHIFRRHFEYVIQAKSHHCNRCDYKTYKSRDLRSHKLTHLKPEEIQYFYCYHCPYKAKWKETLKRHIFRHFKKEQIKFDCYICNFMTPKRELIIKHIKKHSKVQNKSEITEGS